MIFLVHIDLFQCIMYIILFLFSPHQQTNLGNFNSLIKFKEYLRYIKIVVMSNVD